MNNNGSGLEFHLSKDHKTIIKIVILHGYGSRTATLHSITPLDREKIEELAKLYYPYIHDSYIFDNKVRTRVPVDMVKVFTILRRF